MAIRNPLYETPEIALVNAGKCSAAAGDNAARPTSISAARCSFARTTPPRPTTSRCSATRRGRLPESRALMKVVLQQTTPAPEALFLGMCIERKLGDRRPSSRT